MRHPRFDCEADNVGSWRSKNILACMYTRLFPKSIQSPVCIPKLSQTAIFDVSAAILSTWHICVRLHIYYFIVLRLQGVSSGVAKVANGVRLLSARGTLTDLCHGLVVVAHNRRRGLVHVPDTAAPKRSLARRIISRWCVDVTSVLLNRCLDIAEHRAFDERPRRSAFDGMSNVVVPEVVDDVDDGIASELGRAALGVVDVIVLEGDCVLRAGQVHGPVVVGVAAGGPFGLAVDEVVGDCDAGVFGVTGDDVLAADERCLSEWLAVDIDTEVRRKSVACRRTRI